MRTPVFELHILPMMRLLDRDHMIALPPGSAIDLWSYDDVVARAGDILDRVETARDMPPNTHGGPWPEEWAAVFRRWIDSGFKRLSVGTSIAAPSYSIANGVSTLRVSVTLPSPSHRSWFDLEEISDSLRRYVIVVEAPDAADAGGPAVVNLRERYRMAQPHSLFVRDSNGTVQVDTNIT
jgi:hypothetical protein